MRYLFEPTVNELNNVCEELDKEIKNLSRLTVSKMNEVYSNFNLKVDTWNIIRQDSEYKEHFLKKALESYDTITRLDFS